MRVLRQPQLVRRSVSDATIRLFYEFYAQTVLGGRWLCAVVTSQAGLFKTAQAEVGR